jgi:hypothetical protein
MSIHSVAVVEGMEDVDGVALLLPHPIEVDTAEAVADVVVGVIVVAAVAEDTVGEEVIEVAVVDTKIKGKGACSYLIANMRNIYIYLG